MGHRAFRGIVSIAVLSAAVMLAGCQSNPKPPPLDAASAAASPTPSESNEAAPTLPAEAKGTSEASAKAFVRHYIALINHAVATGNTGPLAEASDESCRSCSAIVDRIDKVYQQGGSINSDGWRVTSIQPVPAQPTTRPAFDVGLMMPPQVVIEREASSPTKFDGGRLPATFVLARSGAGWQVKNWERAA